MVKNLSAMWKTWVRSLGQEDPLEKEMATHTSILAWKISWTEELGGLQSKGYHLTYVKYQHYIPSDGKASAYNVGDPDSIPG